MNMLSFLPDALKQRILDEIVGVLVQQAERHGGDRFAAIISRLSSQSALKKDFDTAMKSAIERFQSEYANEDEDLVDAILTDKGFWQSKVVQEALMTLIHRPGARLVDRQAVVSQHFADVLSQRRNRPRVDKAVNYFLACIVEELWTLPGAGELRSIYNLQFQRIANEAAKKQIALLEEQLAATTQLDEHIREALLQLAAIFEKQATLSSSLPLLLPDARPYENLPQPDYIHFIGRQEELNWLRQRLSPNERAWQFVLTGIGGIGKSALALAIAHEHREHYVESPPPERFECIIWVSAKEEILSVFGRERATLPGHVFRTLEDIYTTIAQTLQREDITRAIPEEQDYLVQKALKVQRVLLIVDNLENVQDERVKTFLRNLPPPTKCIITSREWLDVADILKLSGLPVLEAKSMLEAEIALRSVAVTDEEQKLLVERTFGLPLPMKLSVARLASGETFDQVMRWLGDVTGDLPEYCVKEQMEMAHQRNSGAWKLLLACSLGEKEAGISRDALGYIADLSLLDRDDGLTLLQRLSLLNVSRPNRFWMLPFVQGCAFAELAKAEFSEQLVEHWLTWLLNFTQRYGNNLSLQSENVLIVGTEYAHIKYAIQWCRQQGNWAVLLQLAEKLWCYPYIIGLFTELEEILDAARCACLELQDERWEGRFIRRRGLLSWARGQYTEELLGYLDTAEAIARRYNDEIELGFVSNLRWDILFHQGKLQEAEALSKAALEIGERLDDFELKILSAEQLSELETSRRNFAQAFIWLDLSGASTKLTNISRDGDPR
jgi:hypothetical protein